MSRQGDYVKLNRSILEWEWWSDINTYRVFTYMLLKANWKDNSFKGIDVSRGSFVSSLSKISEETNLTENEVRTAIKHLKSTGEITSKAHSKFTVFTVKNYDVYQSDNRQNHEEITSKSQTDNEQITDKSQPINKLLTTIEEKKEKKKGEEKKEGKNEKKYYNARTRKQKCFNAFPQTDYDFDELEEQILSN